MSTIKQQKREREAELRGLTTKQKQALWYKQKKSKGESIHHASASDENTFVTPLPSPTLPFTSRKRSLSTQLSPDPESPMSPSPSPCPISASPPVPGSPTYSSAPSTQYTSVSTDLSLCSPSSSSVLSHSMSIATYQPQTNQHFQ